MAVLSPENGQPGIRSNFRACLDDSVESAALNVRPTSLVQPAQKNVDVASGELEQVAPTRKTDAKQKWGFLFRGPPAAPKCRHGEACKLKRVGKAGPNKGRTFWSCARAAGRRGDREANCNFFQWAPFAANKPLPE